MVIVGAIVFHKYLGVQNDYKTGRFKSRGANWDEQESYCTDNKAR